MIDDEDFARELRLKHLGMELAPTGDPYFDMWEKQLSEGKIPEMEAGEDSRILKRDALMRKAARHHYLSTGEILRNPEAPEVMGERIRTADPLEFNADEYLSRDDPEGSLEEESFSSETDALEGVTDAVNKLSPEAIDRFWNAAGLIKKE